MQSLLNGWVFVFVFVSEESSSPKFRLVILEKDGITD